jgi:predicted permease
VLSDFRLAFRQLAKSPGFTAVAVLSLALGIGANTAIFSLVNDFLLRSLPVRNPEELVLFRYVAGSKDGGMSRSESGNSTTDPVTGLRSGTSFSLLAFERFAGNHPGLSHVFAFSSLAPLNVLIDGQPEISASGQLVSGSYHEGLGVAAVLGRTLTPADDLASSEPVAVISARYWQHRFGGTEDVLGRAILVNKVPVTIVGVTPPGFEGAGQAGDTVDITVPLAHTARFRPGEVDELAKPWYWWVRIMGRVAPGSTAAQARASLEPVFQNAALEGWEAGRSLDQGSRPAPALPTLAADPGAQGENDVRRQYRQSLRILMGLVSLVLLAACANVANLLLARGAARRREFAVRLALGAGRARIIRQLLAEAALLAGLGAAFGTGLAWASRGLLRALRPLGGAGASLELPLDAQVLGFTIAVAAVTAVLFGLAPALRATRLDLNAEFQGGTRSAAAGGRSHLSSALMVVQIALSLVLLVSTALFVRTLRNLQDTDAGFNRRQLVLFRLDATSAGYAPAQYLPLQTRVQERLRTIPGVQAATFSQVPLLNRGRWSSSFNIVGYTPPPGVSVGAHMNAVAPDFFATLGMPLVLGRGFTEHDREGAPRVAVVNQAFVRKFFPTENPLGRRFTFGRATGQPSEVEIVGVSRDAKYTSLREVIPPTVFLPVLQRASGGANYMVRVEGDMPAVFPAIRAVVREIDATLPVLNLRTQDEQIDRIQGQELLFARLSGFFGLLALALACVGLYGLMSYNVLRRTGEIGVRMALGALPGHVLRMILGESLGLICLGVVLGLAGAWFASRLVATMMFGLSATDPFTYALMAGLLVLVAVGAALIPANRAARTDPLVALRAE